jgi:hypothetical protein
VVFSENAELTALYAKPKPATFVLFALGEKKSLLSGLEQSTLSN